MLGGRSADQIFERKPGYGLNMNTPRRTQSTISYLNSFRKSFRTYHLPKTHFSPFFFSVFALCPKLTLSLLRNSLISNHMFSTITSQSIFSSSSILLSQHLWKVLFHFPIHFFQSDYILVEIFHTMDLTANTHYLLLLPHHHIIPNFTVQKDA